MSRVTSLDGLYVTNAEDDFTFHHGSGSAAPGVKEVRDEYLSLERHELPSLEKVIRFMPYRRESGIMQRNTTFVIAHNVQSLHAQKEDVETDDVLKRADYFVLNET